MRRLISNARGSYLSRRSRLALVTGILLLAAVCFSALWSEGARAAATITVDNTTDDAALTTCTAAANDCSLRGAIAAALPGDTINFDAAVFSSPQIIMLGGTELSIGTSLTIQGPGANQLTVSGNNASRVFFIASGNTVTLDGLTISNGQQVSGSFPIGFGGGIFNDEATLTVSRSTVSNNSASAFGGGIYNDSGTLTVSHSTVSNNTSSNESGGGIGNRDTSGGAATLTVSNSTISGNSASIGGGGGVFNESISTSTATISNSTISGNNAVEGGGIQNSTGGGTAALNISNSTVSGNSASNNSGGILNLSSLGGTAVATLNSTIVSDNSAPGSPDIGNFGSTLSGSYNLVEMTAGYSFSSGSNNITGVDPLLEKDEMGQPLLKDNGGPTKTIALLCGSPAIDKGISNSLPTDQRGTGFARTFDDPATPDATDRDGTDIGAFERQQLCNTPPTITGATISRQQGAASSNSQIATVADNEDDEDDLTITIDGGSSATANGVTVSTLVVDSSGNVTADVVAICSATNASFTVRATDSGGLFNEATLSVNVTASNAPTITLKPSLAPFPNNHKYTTVTLSQMVQSATDDCDGNLSGSVVIEKVTSDEVDNAPGNSDGNTVNDIVIASDCKSVRLRAERDGNRNGRVYVVTLRVRDASGNTTRAEYQVTVPLSQNGSPAVQDAIAFTVTSSCP